MGLNTGLRHSEVRELRWKDVDLDERVLVVGKTKTKAGSGRAVPLTQPAWAAFDVWASRFPDRKLDDYLFPACENGKIDTRRQITHWRTGWRHACREACLDGLRFHDLRHTAATALLEQGTPYAVVAQILGWSASTAVRMAKRYAHIRPEGQKQALDALATPEIEPSVHQIGNQMRSVVKSAVVN